MPLVPIGKAPAAGSTHVTSLKLARKLTSKFHRLLNEEATLHGAPGVNVALPTMSTTEREERLAAIEGEMGAMGGREAYQEASALATKNFRSSRFVFKKLVGYGMQPRRGEPKLKVLEIGAVNAQLVVCPWMAVRAIDITSRDPKHIEEKDFFDIPVLDAVAGEYDVLVNAMVVNCVPDPVKRGEMILRCHDHLKPGGLMFFALPSRCIDMSEFLTRKGFEALMVASGFTIRDDHRTPKISFYILQRTDGIHLDAGGGEVSVPAWTSTVSNVKKSGKKGSPAPAVAAAHAAPLHTVASVFFAGTGRAAPEPLASNTTATADSTGTAASVVASSAAPSGAASLSRSGGGGGGKKGTNVMGGEGKRARYDDGEADAGAAGADADDESVDEDTDGEEDTDDDAGSEGGETAGKAAGTALSGVKRKREHISGSGSGSGSGAGTVPSVGAEGLAKLHAQFKRATALYRRCHTATPSTAATTTTASGSTPSSGSGGEWCPLLFSRSAEDYKALRWMTPPPKPLPKSELPVTGFTRTDFCICVPEEWVIRSSTPHVAKPATASASDGAIAADGGAGRKRKREKEAGASEAGTTTPSTADTKATADKSKVTVAAAGGAGASSGVGKSGQAKSGQVKNSEQKAGEDGSKKPHTHPAAAAKPAPVAAKPSPSAAVKPASAATPTPLSAPKASSISTAKPAPAAVSGRASGGSPGAHAKSPSATPAVSTGHAHTGSHGGSEKKQAVATAASKPQQHTAAPASGGSSKPIPHTKPSSSTTITPTATPISAAGTHGVAGGSGSKPSGKPAAAGGSGSAGGSSSGKAAHSTKGTK